MAFFINNFNAKSDYDTFVSKYPQFSPQVAHTITEDLMIIPESINPKPTPPVSDKYLTFTSSGESTIKTNGNAWSSKTMEYSYDKTTWNTWTYNTDLTFGTTEHPSIYVRGNNPTGLSTESQTCKLTFTGTTPIECSGNIMHLLSYTEDLLVIPNDYCFGNMFNGATNLVSAPALPATTITKYCYRYMFNGCSSLVSAPALPATTITQNCYRYMFNGCSSLVSAPELPAMTIPQFAYFNMFNGCSALVSAPALPATNIANSCYKYMFANCSSLVNGPSTLPATTLYDECYSFMFSGCSSLVNAPSLPSTSLYSYCYLSMFFNCTELVNAPVLSATTLKSNCYAYMFKGCSKLNYIKCLATDISETNCTKEWTNGVAASGTFEKDPSMNDWTTGINGIPTNWEVTPKTVTLKFHRGEMAEAAALTYYGVAKITDGAKVEQESLEHSKFDYNRLLVVGTPHEASVYKNGGISINISDTEDNFADGTKILDKNGNILITFDISMKRYGDIVINGITDDAFDNNVLTLYLKSQYE